ncbi:MAG: hemolysin family protein [Blastocatellia bacterium]|nr:hemolysin family protein [Blastocatellia bacterium]MCS7156895.1 hemolysin family protein [Blastocatellia bacterium]MCX7752094.1 hemolysin family protein [Blastocatellia bacterium]MDW8167587.1 hemolysin family protein [Acidobacteriota bacterium]MDW8256187.1 hemolysin family protein [Acidobacteriota bacterium]
MLTLASITCLLILVLLATFESALAQLSDVQLRVLLVEQERRFRSRLLRELVENRQRLLLTLSMGMHLMTVLLAITTVFLFQRWEVEHPLAAGLVAMILVVGVFRQFLPRLLVQNDPERMLLRLLPVISAFYALFWPPAYPIYRALQAAKARTPEPPEEESSGEEIQAFIDVGEQEGIIEESEGQLIQSIVELGDRRVRDVMTPRSDIVAIPLQTTIEDALRTMVETRYSRLPVYREHLDDIEGIVVLRDLVAAYLAGRGNERVTAAMRPAYFVPETKGAAELLQEMKRARLHIALVVDEYGGIAGLVTLEDLLEEIIGEIHDEGQPEPAEILAQPDGTFLVKGTTDVRKLELFFRTEIESDDFTTVAGLILKHLDHLPTVGEGIEYKGFRFEVVDADARRIRTVRVHPPPPPSPSPEEEGGISHATTARR